MIARAENRVRLGHIFGAALICSLFTLSFAPSARADAIYKFSDPADGISWSFDVPGIIVNESGEMTTITSFLNTSVLPLPNPSFIPAGCNTVDDVGLYWTDGAGLITTTLSGEGRCSAGTSPGVEFGRIVSFGTYQFSGVWQGNLNTWTLTISQIPNQAPEPGSLLLLGIALIGVLGLHRRGWA